VKTLRIDPVTRLEGHARIDIHLDDEGEVQDCHFIAPELRGFERFVQGRPVEELPDITSRICGVCPEAHHAASIKTVEAVYGVVPPEAARCIRRLQYAAFCAGDHATHFFVLGGPDLILGPDTPVAQRNIAGIVAAVGKELVAQVVQMRREAHEVAALLGGRRIHPVGTLPGGQAKAVTKEVQARLVEIGDRMVAFSLQSLKLFRDSVLEKPHFRELLESDDYRCELYSAGLVDAEGRLDDYDGEIRVVDPAGGTFAQFPAQSYLDHFSEHVEPWTYLKFPFLKAIGWKGLVGGAKSGVYRSGPLAMVNAAGRMKTPEAQAELERMAAWFGGLPVHSTLAYHWARLIEMTQCAEQVSALARDERLTDPAVFEPARSTPREGIGVVEAPRGLLIHHYVTDVQGRVERANLIVGTTHNHAAISTSVTQAARGLIRKGVVPHEPLLNRIEMAFRAYDPCVGCATHAVGTPLLELRILDAAGALVERLIGKGTP